MVYIAKAPSTAATFSPSGAIWTKIYQSGLLTVTPQTWATDVVNATGGMQQVNLFMNAWIKSGMLIGKHSVTIPKSLPAGEYLLRMCRLYSRDAVSYRAVYRC